MSKTIALSVAIKPYHALIVRYIEKNTNKRRKCSIPIRELDQAGDDPARFMKGKLLSITNNNWFLPLFHDEKRS